MKTTSIIAVLAVAAVPAFSAPIPSQQETRALSAAEIDQLFTVEGVKTLLGIDKRSEYGHYDLIERRLSEVEALNGRALSTEEIKQFFTLDGLKKLLGVDATDDITVDSLLSRSLDSRSTISAPPTTVVKNIFKDAFKKLFGLSKRDEDITEEDLEVAYASRAVHPEELKEIFTLDFLKSALGIDKRAVHPEEIKEIFTLDFLKSALGIDKRAVHPEELKEIFTLDFLKSALGIDKRAVHPEEIKEIFTLDFLKSALGIDKRAVHPEEIKQIFTLDFLKSIFGIHKRGENLSGLADLD